MYNRRIPPSQLPDLTGFFLFHVIIRCTGLLRRSVELKDSVVKYYFITELGSNNYKIISYMIGTILAVIVYKKSEVRNYTIYFTGEWQSIPNTFQKIIISSMLTSLH